MWPSQRYDSLAESEGFEVGEHTPFQKVVCDIFAAVADPAQYEEVEDKLVEEKRRLIHEALVIQRYGEDVSQRQQMEMKWQNDMDEFIRETTKGIGLSEEKTEWLAQGFVTWRKYLELEPNHDPMKMLVLLHDNLTPPCHVGKATLMLAFSKMRRQFRQKGREYLKGRLEYQSTPPIFELCSNNIQSRETIGASESCDELKYIGKRCIRCNAASEGKYVPFMSIDIDPYPHSNLLHRGEWLRLWKLPKVEEEVFDLSPASSRF